MTTKKARIARDARVGSCYTRRSARSIETCTITHSGATRERSALKNSARSSCLRKSPSTTTTLTPSSSSPSVEAAAARLARRHFSSVSLRLGRVRASHRRGRGPRPPLYPSALEPRHDPRDRRLAARDRPANDDHHATILHGLGRTLTSHSGQSHLRATERSRVLTLSRGRVLS